jgi:hypothetical protein
MNQNSASRAKTSFLAPSTGTATPTRVPTTRRHDMKCEFIGRLPATGEGVFTEPHQLAAREQPMRIDVRRDGARFAARFE